jgi:hypothetical protein
MGLEKQEAYIYLNIRDGRLVQQVPKGTPGAIERTVINSRGEQVPVNECFYKSVAGMLVNISVYAISQDSPEWGERWIFTLRENSTVFRLQVNEKASSLYSILFALPNCNFSLPIYFRPYDFVSNEGKRKIGVTLKQGNDETAPKVSWFFTREAPHGMPPLKQYTAEGKEHYDNYDRRMFLRQYVQDNIVPKLSEGGKTAHTAANAVSKPNTDTNPLDSLSSPIASNTGMQQGYDAAPYGSYGAIPPLPEPGEQPDTETDDLPF